MGTAPDMVPQGWFNRTAEEEAVHEHPGCGCRVAGFDRGSLGGGAGVLAGIALAFARRRRVTGSSGLGAKPETSKK